MVRSDAVRGLPDLPGLGWIFGAMLLSLIGLGKAREIGSPLRLLVLMLALPGIVLGSVPVTLAAIPVVIGGAVAIAVYADWRDGRSLRQAAAMRVVLNRAQLLSLVPGRESMVEIGFDSYRIELLDADARPLDLPLTDLPVSQPLRLSVPLEAGELLEAQIVAGSRDRGEVAVYMICDAGDRWVAENMTVDFPTWKTSL